MSKQELTKATKERVPRALTGLKTSLRRAGAMLVRGPEQVRKQEAYEKAKASFGETISGLNLNPSKPFEAVYTPEDADKKEVAIYFNADEQTLDIETRINPNGKLNAGHRWSHDSYKITFEDSDSPAIVDTEGTMYTYKRDTLRGEEIATPYRQLYYVTATKVYEHATEAVTALLQGQTTGETALTQLTEA
ncbi:MAG TPA: hypothetical protein VLG37_03125 [Candidatus Saccharimonadales bacterium]|nr:hypothetical protein [Candidatus Saccharimonadales bacterium]